ncbi:MULTISPECIES: hypothetical protein [unclassified Paenibacillus]|uniref:hypothetical protein n=1 Tax=unclassified Paenibacillus TaxID=185978 RepID=UPI003639AB1F
MSHTQVCGLCYQEAKEPGWEGDICDTCQDILEFGYRSFPAYELKNTSSDDLYKERPYISSCNLHD